MKKLMLVLFLCLIGSSLYAQQTILAELNLTWNGKDTQGKIENSLPVSFRAYNAKTNTLMGTSLFNGPVTNFHIPIVITMPRNHYTNIVYIYTVLSDSVGNKKRYPTMRLIIPTGGSMRTQKKTGKKGV
jgi:hypothetical protein